MFNIIARKTLLDFCTKYPSAAIALQEWYHEMIHCDFKSLNELKMGYGNASHIADDRVVFNILGNRYRLVVRIVFQYQVVQIKWFGTHAEYNVMDVTSTKFKKKKS